MVYYRNNRIYFTADLKQFGTGTRISNYASEQNRVQEQNYIYVKTEFKIKLTAEQ